MKLLPRAGYVLFNWQYSPSSEVRLRTWHTPGRGIHWRVGAEEGLRSSEDSQSLFQLNKGECLNRCPNGIRFKIDKRPGEKGQLVKID